MATGATVLKRMKDKGGRGGGGGGNKRKGVFPPFPNGAEPLVPVGLVYRDVGIHNKQQPGRFKRRVERLKPKQPEIKIIS